MTEGPLASAARTSSRFVSDFDPGREREKFNG
jgi:hypothetical protein